MTRLAARLQSSAGMNTGDPEWLPRLSSRTPDAPMTIVEVMTRAPHTIGRDQKLARAFAVMHQHSLRHLPVLDGGQLVGVLSQRDLYFVESLGGTDEIVDKVAEAMASDVYQVAPGELVADVARTMAKHKYGCAVVVDRGQVVGIFTATDALALLADAMS